MAKSVESSVAIARRACLAMSCVAMGAGLLLFATAAPAQLRFVEVSKEWGIDFVHHHAGSGRRYMVETVVGGVLLFDYDGDGDVDVLLVDGGVLPGYEGEAPRSRLYRNDQGSFRDVTQRAGIDFEGYGSGVTAGDYDGDGDLDVYLTAFGSNVLLRNEGDGTFVDATQEAGVADTRWGTSAAFADVDRDGDLDLFVVNYVDFTLENHKECGNPAKGVTSYCHPDSFEGQSDAFFRNLGNGRFANETAAAGFSSAIEAGLGVVFTDLNGDLYPELYVSNDLDPNLLFVNRQGHYEDTSLLSGTAYSNVGKPEAGMGVESADLNGDGLFDLIVTNFALETTAFYQNAGNGLFVDRRFPSRLAEPSLRTLGFGVVALDVDHDRDQDLVIANGHTLDNVKELSPEQSYAQRNQLMLNRGDGTFSEELDSGLDLVRVSRGLAAGDLDGDGDLELVVGNSNQPVEVYENRSEGLGNWLLADLVGRDSNLDGIGARVLARVEGVEQIRERRTASSYLSQNALSLHFGLAGSDFVDLEVLWPGALPATSGGEAPGQATRSKTQRFLQLPVNRRVVIYE